MKTLAILDADIFCFLSAYPYKDNMTSLGAMAAKKQLDKTISAVIKKLNVDLYLGFYGLPGKKNFRYDVATIRPYKGSRDKPPWQKFFIPKLKDHMGSKWGFYGCGDIEADDAVVIAHHQFKDEYDITHVGEDKDMHQVGEYKRYNPKKKITNHYEHWEGRKFFWKQMLMGDTTDGIDGIKGVGKANKLLTELDEIENPTESLLYNFVWDAYLNKYGEDAQDVMIENYLLLHMLEEPRFDYPKEITLTENKNKEQMYETNTDIIDI